MPDRRSYIEVLRDSDVVAMKQGQQNRRLTDDYMTGNVLPSYKCGRCDTVFVFGYRPGFPPRNLLGNYPIKLQYKLDANHGDGIAHRDFYKLGW